MRLENEINSENIYMCRTANMSWRMRVVVKEIQSNQIQSDDNDVNVTSNVTFLNNKNDSLNLW